MTRDICIDEWRLKLEGFWGEGFRLHNQLVELLKVLIEFGVWLR